MAARLTEIIVDAADPAGLAAFWAEVLGWRLEEPEDEVVEIVNPNGVPPSLVFVPVPEPKSTKNRVHLDVNPTGCDQEEELDRLRSLGAVPVDVGQGQQSWFVLADPEGNEFCLLRTRVD